MSQLGRPFDLENGKKGFFLAPICESCVVSLEWRDLAGCIVLGVIKYFAYVLCVLLAGID